jgi:uncharacterized repeat protein (TIGR02543 family)
MKYQLAISKEKIRKPNFRSLFAICYLLFAVCSLIISCKNPFMKEIIGLTPVSFNSNGGSEVAGQDLFRGERVRRPANPVRPNYQFDGWYKDNDTFQDEWDFDIVPDRELTLHAKWAEMAAVIDMTLKSSPVELEYRHGELLDLFGLIVTLLYDNDTRVDVAHVDFALYNITLESGLYHNMPLSHSAHDALTIRANRAGFNVDAGTLIVNKITVSDNFRFPTASDITFGQTLAHSMLAQDGTSPVPGHFRWESPAAIPEFGTSSHFVSFVPNDTINYDYSGVQGWNESDGTISRLVPVTVTGAQGVSVADFAVAGDNSNPADLTIIVTAELHQPTGQSLEYAIGLSNDITGLTWQAEPEFTNRSADTTYYVFARSAQSGNFTAGQAMYGTMAFFTVNFNSNGGTPVDSTIAVLNTTIAQPVDPTRNDFDFIGWFTHQTDFTEANRWNFISDTVTESLTLFARWDALPGSNVFNFEMQPITEQNPNIDIVTGLILSRSGSGVYSPTATITVTNASIYTNIQWLFGVNDVVLGTGPILELDLDDITAGQSYNIVGTQSIFVQVTVPGGVTFGRTITFEVIP